ncbi:hypothetical protein BS78_05G043300 [Paspalum vaginatum]|nr:hypothetical protein BS78_05G043300 [Paspalum vaginatum]
MFPSLDDGEDMETTDGVISYVPHSDGVDDGSLDAMDAEDRARRHRASSESLSAIAARLADRGRPVTYIVSPRWLQLATRSPPRDLPLRSPCASPLPAAARPPPPLAASPRRRPPPRDLLLRSPLAPTSRPDLHASSPLCGGGRRRCRSRRRGGRRRQPGSDRGSPSRWLVDHHGSPSHPAHAATATEIATAGMRSRHGRESGLPPPPIAPYRRYHLLLGGGSRERGGEG